VKLVLSILTFCMLLVACRRSSPTDSALRQKIVGTWQISYGVTILAANGNFVCKATNRWSTGSKEFSYEGTWQLQDGILIFTYTKTSEPKYMPVGKVERCQVIRAEEQELALFFPSENETNILRRIN
jgi:hypothetical protein